MYKIDRIIVPISLLREFNEIVYFKSWQMEIPNRGLLSLFPHFNLPMVSVMSMLLLIHLTDEEVESFRQ
jgi:hypothetical protein